MPVLEHTHSWVQWKKTIGHKKFPHMIAGEIAFKCNHPDCTTFKQRSLVLGLNSVCPKCGETFLLTGRKLKNAVPVCDMCSNTKRGKELKQARGLVDLILSETPEIKEDSELLKEQENAIHD